MLITATRMAEWCGGRRHGGDPMLAGVCIDSRCVQRGNLFVALPGARADGHEFIPAAVAQGAVAAMVSKPVKMTATQVMVSDCASALAQVAGRWRRRFNGQVVAVTGSNGKTTVKEMLGGICRSAVGNARMYRSSGNMNNRLGLSLSVLKLRSHHQLAVLEAGMDAAGELLELGGICQPQVAVVNNAQRAHLGGFASLKEIARAKGELIETLPADGIAVLNADDAHFPLWKKAAGKRRVIAFGFHDNAGYRGEYRAGQLQLPMGGTPIALQVAGKHNIGNALAAAAAAVALNLPAAAIRDGLTAFAGAPGRLQFKQVTKKLLLIDDSYNANPDSMAAALAVLAGCAGDKFAVLGDMLALGAAAEAEHQTVGRLAAAAGAELLAVGDEMKAAAGGDRAQHFADKESLCKFLRKRLSAGTSAAVLVKGSRGMGMETVVQELERLA